MVRDGNDDEEELEIIREEQEEKMTTEKRMIKSISSIGGKPKLNTHVYSNSLNPGELIDWIGEMEKYFEFKWIKDPMRVIFVSRN